MTRIAHLTDPHLDESAERGMRLRVAAQAARQVGADVLAVTGDLSRDGREDQLMQLFEILVQAGWPPRRLFIIPGNHDRTRKSWHTTLLDLGLLPAFAHCAAGNWSDLGDCAIYCVDSRMSSRAVAFRALGKLGAEAHPLGQAAEWALARRKPLVALMHHPPHISPLQKFDGLTDRDVVVQMLEELPNLYFLCGHDHRCLDLMGGRAFVAPAVVDVDDPLRLYQVQGGRLVSVKSCSPGRYLRIEP